MPRDPQFGMRKNPAPHARQHGLCLAADSLSVQALISDESEAQESTTIASTTGELHSPFHAAPMRVATAEEQPNHNRLLTVTEVADLLQVPVSWVYARTRKRSLGRLPGYRLGKYWRFSEAEVLDWLQSQKHNVRAA